MSKRRISKQQSKRIADKQESYQQDTSNQSELNDGLLISCFGRKAEIEDAKGRRIICAIRPSIDPLVAGDKVIWQAEEETHGVIISRYPRESVLARPTVRGPDKPVAANITQMIIVVAPKPEISWSLLDSYLIMSESLGIQAVILLNKTDIPCDLIKEKLISIYQPLGYPLLFTSKEDDKSYEKLTGVLNHQVSVFIGQSGVGKSSLISAILPHETIDTQAISSISELGKHTTSNSRFYHLKPGGALIDSPGVREFNLVQLDQKTITRGYVEFRPYLSECKFRNCNHIDSLGCAIRVAVEQQQISQLRYDNFVKLSRQYAKN